MKPISPRPIFTLSLFTTSNQKLISNSNFLAFSTQGHQSSYNPRRNDDESRAVPVSVWWDFENCSIPVNTSAFRVAPSIANALRANGIRGPIQITAFGDFIQLSRTNQEALSSMGVSLTHVPGGKNSADRSLLVDLMFWVSRNPPPAHIFLISGDRYFAGILHRLRMNNYNILLASPETAPSVLCSVSTIMWQWNSLLKGETLSGKLFNQPPDGPYHSWYGHFKAPLQDAFAVTGQSSCFVADKSSDVASDSNLLPIPKVVTEQSPCLGGDESSDMAPNSRSRPIPKALMRHIYRMLKSHPEGMSVSQLRSELYRIRYSIDRELYGYKKFTRFLSAMPHILELQYGNDGSILVRSVNNKSLDEPVPAVNVEPGSSNGEPEVDSISKTCDERSSSEDVKEKLTVDPKMKAGSTNLQEVGKEGKRNGSLISTKIQAIKMEANGANLQDLKKDESRKTSIPKRVTQVKLKNQPEKVEVALPVVEKNDFSEKNTDDFEVAPPVVEKKDFSENNPEIFKMAPPVGEKKGFPEKNEEQLLVPNDHKYTFGIFRRIWMKLFGSRDTKRDDASNEKVIVPDKVEKNDETAKQLDINVEKKGETAGHFEVNTKRLDIFAEESFWKEMESFIDSSEGSAIFSKSKTRDRLVQNLQKQGPPFLKSLSESDLLHLVDLLISDKKWVEECNSRFFPFRLTRSVKNRPLSSNGLSHIFSGRQANQEPGEKKHHNSPHTGVPQTIIQRGSSSKTRSELLTDCQKVVHQIIKEHPEGFNIGGFKKMFFQKHGYALDLEKLGYDKVVKLLQIMPEVRIESNLILPAGALRSFDSQSIAGPVVNSSTKDDDSDSSFDELGPASDSSGSENEEITGKSSRRRPEKFPDYELLNEEDISDSEEETSPPTRSENVSKAKWDEEDSVLLEILESYHSEKGGDSSKKKESASSANVTASEGIGSQPVVVNLPRKRKTGKSYSFVAEQQPVGNEDKLVDGILGSWKKSSDKPADSKVLS